MGANHSAAAPLALYGAVLLMAAIAFLILQRAIIVKHGVDSVLVVAIGKNIKGKLSILLYAIAIPVVFVAQWLAGTLYILVALIWLIPDCRIEHTLGRVEDVTTNTSSRKNKELVWRVYLKSME